MHLFIRDLNRSLSLSTFWFHKKNLIEQLNGITSETLQNVFSPCHMAGLSLWSENVELTTVLEREFDVVQFNLFGGLDFDFIVDWNPMQKPMTHTKTP